MDGADLVNGETMANARGDGQDGGREGRLRRAVAIGVLVALATMGAGCANRYGELDLTMYEYRDTRNLVKFVYDAAYILNQEGMDALSRFQARRKEYRTEDYYLYVYDSDGTNLFHAGMEELEGQNLWDVTDKDGKPVFQQVIEALENQSNPHAWVHYSWWEPERFYPVPKSSCHFRIETPEADVLIVGGGLNYPHEEPEFIRIVVDDAVRLIEKEGDPALDEIADPTSEYSYRDVRVFVFRPDGEMLISAAINSTFSQTNLLECVDEVGQRPFVQALDALESEESVWEAFMETAPYQRQLIRKSLYIRKTNLAGDEIYVAAITDLPEPPY